MTATYLKKGQGKSNNAYYAESCGIYPLTTAVKVISRVIRPYYKITQKTIRNWLEQMGPCEWHHVGKYAIEVNYYDTEGIIDLLFDVCCSENIFIDEIEIHRYCPHRYSKLWMK